MACAWAARNCRQLTLDSPVAPGRILPRHPDDQRLDRGPGGGSSWPGPTGVVPLAGDEAPVPAQDRGRGDREDLRPPAAAHQRPPTPASSRCPSPRSDDCSLPRSAARKPPAPPAAGSNGGAATRQDPDGFHQRARLAPLRTGQLAIRCCRTRRRNGSFIKSRSLSRTDLRRL
jgi:hypothetical protein